MIVQLKANIRSISIRKKTYKLGVVNCFFDKNNQPMDSNCKLCTLNEVEDHLHVIMFVCVSISKLALAASFSNKRNNSRTSYDTFHKQNRCCPM